MNDEYEIAVTIHTPKEAEQVKGQADLVEFKLDDYYLQDRYDLPDLKELALDDMRTILTMPRPAENEYERILDDKSKEILEELNPYIDFTDIELDNRGSLISDREYEKRLKEFIKVAKEGDTSVVLSHHNYEFTPIRKDLDRTLNKEIDAGADIAKICTTAKSREDDITMLRLAKETDFPFLGWGMENGFFSRVLSAHPYVGGEWTFASKGKKSAPGQVPLEVVRSDWADLSRESADGIINYLLD